MTSQELRLITALVIAMIAITDMATDLYAPTLPALVDYFDVSETTISWTLNISMLGFCLTAPLYGPLSDAFGRRAVINFGLIIFTIGNIACCLAPNPTLLIIARFIEGMGVTIGYVIGVAVVKDLFRRESYSKVMSSIHMAVSATPALAPVIGSYVGEYMGWRMNFVILSVIGIILLFYTIDMPETLPEIRRKPFNLKRLSSDYWDILSNREFLSYASLSGIIYSGWWIYLAEIPHIFDRLSVPATHFGYYHTYLISMFIIGAYCNRRTVEHYGIEAIFRVSLWLVFIGSWIFFTTAWYFPNSSYAICASLSLYSLSLGGIFANASAFAMENFPHKAGAASATLSCIENLIPAVFLGIMTYFFNRTPLPLALGILLSSSFALILYTVIRRDVGQETKTAVAYESA